MAAERTPRDSWASRRLEGLARFALLGHPSWVLGFALLLAGLSVWLAVSRLEIRTSRLDVLNPRSEFNARWLRYIAEFGEDDDALVIVEGDSLAHVEAPLREFGERLAARPDLYSSVIHELDTRRLRAKGLYLLEEPSFARLARIVQAARSAMEGGVDLWDSPVVLAQGVEQFRRASNPADRLRAEQEIVRLVESLLFALDASPAYRFPSEAWFESEAIPGRLLADSSGRRAFMLVRLVSDKTRFVQGQEAIRELRAAQTAVQAAYPRVQIGLTGMPVLEHDEMVTSQRDMARASVLSLLGVAILFAAGFGGFVLPLMAVASLLIGIAWTLGFITVSVGHLNLLSVSFGAILIGLGIDFGIHIIARFQQQMSIAPTMGEGLIASLRAVGPGVTTGALTTAVAFFSAALTHFTGVAELGVIAGGGVLLCLISALTVLPALMIQWPAARWKSPRSELNSGTLPLAFLVKPAHEWPRCMLGLMLLLTVVSGLGMRWLRYDHNLLHLQPIGMESVTWEHRLLESDGQNALYAISLSQSPEEMRRKQQAFEQLGTVARTQSLTPFWRGTSPKREREVSAIREALRLIPRAPPADTPAERGAAIGDYERFLAVINESRQAIRGNELSSVAQVLSRLDQRIRSISTAWGAERFLDFERAVRHDTWRRLRELAWMAEQQPPTLDDLPSLWRDRYLGPGGTHALHIYGHGNLWEMDRLEPFVKSLETIDPLVTGHPIQVYHASWQMRRSFVQAAAFALVAVLIVLMLDFRSIRLSCLALVPLGLAIVQTFGLLGLLDIPLNPANLIVLPLILGIGLDDGVHVLHDFLRQPRAFRMSRATATALLVTSATTMVGFGSMMCARHQGLRSLGQVLTLGVFCCLVNSLWVLPAILACAGNHESRLARLLIPASKWYRKVFR